MAIIDSGLGWTCDGDYYVSTAGTTLKPPLVKTNNGGAMCAVVKWVRPGWYDFYCAYIVSTVEDNVAVHNDTEADKTIYSTTYDGRTWYISGGDNNSLVYSGTLPIIDASDIPGYYANLNDDQNRQAIVQAIAGAANTEFYKIIPSTDYVKTFVEGVEAETATRVNALNTSKQPKTMSSAVTVGGVSQSTVEGAIGAMATKISKIDFDINRNLGTEITAAQKLAIATGTFEDLPIGAYWTLNNTVYRIAHHDYYLGTGDTAGTTCTSHHIVVVPDNAMYSAKMNDENITSGGYRDSKMRTENLASALSTFETDFGAAHILNHRTMVANAVSDGQTSGWVWANSKVDLMSENMVYGHTVWGQSGYETGIERGQLALFGLYPEFIQKQRLTFWLRSVTSSTDFCVSFSGGAAYFSLASTSQGVRPYACIYFDDVLT